MLDWKCTYYRYAIYETYCLYFHLCYDLFIRSSMFILQDGFSRMSSNEPASPIIAQRIPGYMDYQGTVARPQFPVDRKWALGLQVKFPQVCLPLYFFSEYRKKRTLHVRKPTEQTVTSCWKAQSFHKRFL